MSEYEIKFIEQLRQDMEAFKQDIDKRYSRMQVFLLSVLTVLLSAGLAVGFTHFTTDGKTRADVASMQTIQKEILKQAATQEAVNNLIMTFDKQTGVLEGFLPTDIQGAVKAFNETSSELRKEIMRAQKGITIGI